MSEPKQIVYAKNVSEIFYQLKNVSGLQIVGGCTQLKKLPQKSLSISNIKELNFIVKHERKLDLGPAATLSEILNLGQQKMPAVLYDAVKSIGSSNIRNMATIAGNICSKTYRHTLFAPLLALDTKLEIKSETETKYIPFSKIDSIGEKWIITKIQIPLDEWEVAVFRRLGPKQAITANSASFVFLANSQKGQLANLKIAFAGPVSFRSIELENSLLGAYLPLSKETIKEFTELAMEKFDLCSHNSSVQFQNSKSETDRQTINASPVLRSQFLNLVKFSLEQLT